MFVLNFLVRFTLNNFSNIIFPQRRTRLLQESGNDDAREGSGRHKLTVSTDDTEAEYRLDVLKYLNPQIFKPISDPESKINRFVKNGSKRSLLLESLEHHTEENDNHVHQTFKSEETFQDKPLTIKEQVAAVTKPGKQFRNLRKGGIFRELAIGREKKIVKENAIFREWKRENEKWWSDRRLNQAEALAVGDKKKDGNVKVHHKPPEFKLDLESIPCIEELLRGHATAQREEINKRVLQGRKLSEATGNTDNTVGNSNSVSDLRRITHSKSFFRKMDLKAYHLDSVRESDKALAATGGKNANSKKRNLQTAEMAHFKYVEFLAVNDYSHYLGTANQGHSTDAAKLLHLTSQAKSIFNLIQAIYLEDVTLVDGNGAAFNNYVWNPSAANSNDEIGVSKEYTLYAVLVGMKTYSTQDPWHAGLGVDNGITSVDGNGERSGTEVDSSKLLSAFHAEAKKQTDIGEWPQHDNRILLSNRNFEGKTIGLAGIKFI